MILINCCGSSLLSRWLNFVFITNNYSIESQKKQKEKGEMDTYLCCGDHPFDVLPEEIENNSYFHA